MNLKTIGEYSVYEVAMFLELLGVRSNRVLDMLLNGTEENNLFDGQRLMQIRSSHELMKVLGLTIEEACIVMLTLSRYRGGLDQEIRILQEENDKLVNELMNEMIMDAAADDDDYDTDDDQDDLISVELDKISVDHSIEHSIINGLQDAIVYGVNHAFVHRVDHTFEHDIGHCCADFSTGIMKDQLPNKISVASKKSFRSIYYSLSGILGL